MMLGRYQSLSLGKCPTSFKVPSINYSAVSVQRALPTSHRLAVAYLCNSTLTYLLAESFDECCRSVWLGCLGPAILDANDTASTLSALYNVRSMTTRNGWRRRRSFHGLGDSNFYGNIEFATRQPSTTHTQARRESSSTRTLAVNTGIYLMNRKQWFTEIGLSVIDWTNHNIPNPHLLFYISSDVPPSTRVNRFPNHGRTFCRHH